METLALKLYREGIRLSKISRESDKISAYFLGSCSKRYEGARRMA